MSDTSSPEGVAIPAQDGNTPSTPGKTLEQSDQQPTDQKTSQATAEAQARAEIQGAKPSATPQAAESQPDSKTTGPKEEEKPSASETSSEAGKLRQQYGEQRKALGTALASRNPHQALIPVLESDPKLADFFERKLKLTVADFKKMGGEVPRTEENDPLFGQLDSEGEEKEKLTGEEVTRMIHDAVAKAEFTQGARDMGEKHNLNATQTTTLANLAQTLQEKTPSMTVDQALNAAKISLHGNDPTPEKITPPLNKKGGAGPGSTVDPNDLQSIKESIKAGWMPKIKLSMYTKLTQKESDLYDKHMKGKNKFLPESA